MFFSLSLIKLYIKELDIMSQAIVSIKEAFEPEIVEATP